MPSENSAYLHLFKRMVAKCNSNIAFTVFNHYQKTDSEVQQQRNKNKEFVGQRHISGDPQHKDNKKIQ